MAYVVKKPLDIGGKRRLIGEILSDQEVSGGAVIRSGYVARVNSMLADIAVRSESPSGAGPTIGQINLPDLSKNGSEGISVSPESICEAVRVMQLSQAEAIAAAEKSEDEDMLAIVGLCESNKTILSAVRKRLSDLEARKAADGGSEGDA